MINKEEVKKTLRKSNIESSIRKSIKEFPDWTVTHGKGTYVIDDKVYKRLKIPMSQLSRGIAIVIHTHGAKYPHSYGDVDHLRKGILEKEIICMVVLSPDLNHYYALYPNFTQANRDKLVAFLTLKPSKIKEKLLPSGMSSVTKERSKLKSFAKEFGLSFIEGFY